MITSEKKNIKDFFLLVIFLYLLSSELCKVYFGALPKAILCLFIGVEAVLFFCSIIHKKIDVKYFYLFSMYYIYIIYNGVIFGNITKMIMGYYQYIFYSFSFFLALYIIPNINIDWIFKILSKVSILLSILSFYEFFSNKLLLFTNNLLGVVLIGDEFVVRSRVFSESFLVWGLLLDFLAIINIYIYIKERKKIYIISAILNIVAELTTSSRGPLMALALAIICYYFLYKFSKKFDKKDLLKTIVLVIFVLSFLIFIIFNENFVTNNTLIDYVLNRIRSIFNWDSSYSNLTRMSLWKNSFNLIKDNIWHGIGIASATSKLMNASTETIITESGVLKIILETGIVGFLLYYSIIIGILIRGIKSLNKVGIIDKNKLILSITIIITILIEDIILQCTESITISFWLWFFLGNIFFITSNFEEREIKKI